jgi:hypothetical protein
VLTAIYVTVMTNRLGETIPAQVPPAVIEAGLPESSVPEFMQAFLLGGDAFAAVPGITDKILAVGTLAHKHASADAYRTVFLVTIGFSALAVILTWWAPDTEDLMTDKVAATLNHEAQTNEKVIEETSSV